MYHTLRVFRPHRTPPEQLERTFVGREPLRQEILDKLQKWQPGKSRQHYLIIGPRGIGKTNLLRLIEYRVEKNPQLNNKWYSISLSEDAYGITKVSDLLVEALRILSDKTNDKNLTSTYNKVQFDDNDERVTDLSLDAFRKFHIENGCGILLMVESVNRVLESQFKVKKEIHLLRKILIEEEWLIFICSSPTYLNAVTKPEEPLFEFFQVKLLEELSPEEQQEMLRKIALLEKNNDFIENYLNKLKPQLRALYHFTGGNPRLTIMLYDLIANQNFRDVKEELDRLLDKLTPFYQDRMKEIADQEAKLLEKMALMAEGSTPTELARQSRMDHKTVSALLTRLERTGYVRREPRRKKRTVYIIPERFFRIWHQMNHSRSARGRIQYLLEFFTSWYATPGERDQIWEKLTAQFQKVLKINKEERIDELSEYMQYIEEISEGEEKYKRHFDRLLKVHNLKGFGAVKGELENLDKEYQNDWNYLLYKGNFLSRKVKRRGEALSAFKKANKLKPDNILVLFNCALFFRGEKAEKINKQIIQILRKEKNINSNIMDSDMLLKIFLDEEEPNIVRITSYLLSIYANERVIEKMISGIKTTRLSLKKQCGITTLGFLKSRRALPVILNFLKDAANNIRGNAATTLGRIGSKKAVPHLIDCLKDEANDVRGSAATALGRIGSKKAVPYLIDCLKDEANNVRGSAATALGQIGSEQAVPHLINCLKDEANNVQGSAATALGRIGFKEAVPYLINCLKDETDGVRGSVATALGRIGSKEVVPYLIDCLKDKANDVRGSAATALGRIGSKKAVPHLIDCLKDEADDVRGSAVTALGQIGSDSAVPYLIECLKVETINVRISSIMSLGEIASKKSIPNLDRLIQALIEMKSDEVLYMIVQVIRKLLFSAFRSSDIDMINASIEHAKKGFENGEEIFRPYIIALEYIKSHHDPAIIERQQPEMREAVQLLVDSLNA